MVCQELGLQRRPKIRTAPSTHTLNRSVGIDRVNHGITFNYGDGVMSSESGKFCIDLLQQFRGNGSGRVDDGHDLQTFGLAAFAGYDAHQAGESPRGPVEDRPDLEELTNISPQEAPPVELPLFMVLELISICGGRVAGQWAADHTLEMLRHLVNADRKSCFAD